MGANASTEQPIQGRALERYRLIQSYLQGTTALATVAGNAGVSLRTAQRWVEKYRKQGVGALGTKERIDRGQRRAMSPKMVELTEGLALERPRVPVTAIYRELGEFAAKSGERLPSYPAVRRAVKAIPISLMTLAHSGSRAYSERFDLIHRREASRPNAIWQADHAQLRIHLLREDGSFGRPWLTIVIDDYSRAIAGYYLGFEPPSSLRTSLALRARLSGAKAMRDGRSAASRKCSTPTMVPTSLPGTWNMLRQT